MEGQYRLEMKNITKHFGGVKALTDVSLKVEPGEIHALIGENGAGKSTLMKILSGAYQRDSGQIFIDGGEVKITNPKESKDLGIAVIYQEFMLAPDLTVAENIFIDKLSGGKGIINWKKLRADAGAQLEKLGFDDINPNAKCGSLSVAYQQVVEICKCLTRDAKILVFDEPTAVLTFSEIEKLFEVINKLKKRNVSVIYISHRLEEIFRLSQHITVLKDGAYVDTVETGGFDKQRLVNMMVGREMTDMFPERHAKIGETVLKVEDLYAGKMVQGVSFEVRAGEVLGFNGLVGAGRTETMRAVFGADKKESGKVYYFGKEVNWKSPQSAIREKFGLLPEDRKKQGLLLEQSVRMNTTLACLSKVTRHGWIQHKKEKKFVKEVLGSIQTKYGSTEDNANSLSGGNQQKLSLAKWIAADCKCVVFDEPTRGVDVGAKTEIYKVINTLAEKGIAVIMISSEMPEIIGMCDRVVIMRNGKVSGEVEKNELSENIMIKMAMGV
ncbi:sugar ABC transporter ATP-binding protein [Muricomes intestini]|jgi:ribose transport system ATP-binding protein|uniref:Monosaccharide ABC transporter ATP-binding protein (CUT2 family) n=1 Tax=Muricomes intestini TaxID=1796634 RepID=A0A4R3KD24_9FIRM|nr:sugar ABC transporter ATP-binding protein [Muricomes intestini]TCS81136.1 monosaccharide ABC transporter ATP-binding protein (CUT2 family) [Muricomes intestini]HAX52054.1 lantibiotic ABC transporter permease [Lachnospiraceae bacterium]